jgi:hypothetical protein
MATSTEEILLRMGLDCSATVKATNEMLDKQKKAAADYVSFWTKATEERALKTAAIEESANKASLARYAALQKNKSDIDKAFFAKQAAMKAIESGSGGHGSGFQTAAHVAEAAGSGAAFGAGGAAGAKMVSSEAKVVEKAALDSVARRELMVMSRELASGNFKRFFSSFSIFIQHCGTAALELAKVGSALLSIGITGYDIVRFGQRLGQKKLAETQEKFSGVDVNLQTAHLGSRFEEQVDAAVKSGAITADQAAQMKLMSGKGSDQLRGAQRYLLAAVTKQEAADAEKKANAEARSLAIQDTQTRLAEAKKIRDRETLELQRQQLAIEKQKQEATNLRTEENRIGASMPTLADLAGRDFTSDLSQKYGAGGIYDLGKGNGYLGGAAREALLAEKQMQWDLTYGNGQWVEGKDGAPGRFTGQAEVDRQRAIRAQNILGAAGLDTPAQKFEAMKQSLANIYTQISILSQAQQGAGLKIQTD